LGLLLGFGVGTVLGLLGGGGSILAVPIFLYVFGVPAKAAIAMSLAVVFLASLVGFLSHWRQGTVHLRVALPFAACTMLSAYATARLTHLVPEAAQLGLFAAFALTSAVAMLRDSLRNGATRDEEEQVADGATFTWIVGLEALGVGALTALIGAGGGFLIVPALVYLAKVPLKRAVGSSLLIIALNTLSGFLGYVGLVPIDWPLVLSFGGVAALGAAVGTRLNRRVAQRHLKLGFALLILALGAYLILRRLW
jgi:hypothetical protein